MSAPPADQVFDVAVVGAGLSGLSAARRIAAAGRSVVVLEARDRVGGKMRTDDVGGHRADMGAHWIGPTQDRVAALAAELACAPEPQHLDGRAVLVRGWPAAHVQGLVAAPLPSRSGRARRLAQLRLDRLRKQACHWRIRGPSPPRPTGTRQTGPPSPGATCARPARGCSSTSPQS